MKIKYLHNDSDIKKSIEDFLFVWNDSNNYIFTNTSGSTGKPKTIKILKSKMRESALMTGNFLKIKEGDKALICLSVNTIAGKMMVVRAIVLKLELLVGSISSNPFQKMNEDIDFVAMVPMQLTNTLLEHPEKLKKIRNIIIGGGIISSFLKIKLKENKITVFHTYGMTETISHVAVRRAGFHDEEIFTAIGSTTFSETSGQLIINSPLLKNQSITTNDCIQLIDNKHFKFTGRSDFAINSGGVKIHPEEVENKLNSIIPLPFFISGLKDNYLGEKVILCIESSEIIPLTKSIMMKLISSYECPKEVYFLPKFEMTESGKINRLKTISKINSQSSVVYL